MKGNYIDSSGSLQTFNSNNLINSNYQWTHMEQKPNYQTTNIYSKNIDSSGSSFNWNNIDSSGSLFNSAEMMPMLPITGNTPIYTYIDSSGSLNSADTSGYLKVSGGPPSKYSINYTNHDLYEFPNSEHITTNYKINFSDILIGNNLYITSNHPIGKKVLLENIYTLSIRIKSELDEDISEYIFGKQYKITGGGATIQNGILSHNPIFKNTHIPFGSIIYHTLAIIIYDIDNNLCNTGLFIEFIQKKMTCTIPKIFMNGLESFGYNIKWGMTDLNGVLTQNNLRIAAGMIGVCYSDIGPYPKNCLAKTKILLKNKISLIKIHKLHKHFIDNFCCYRDIHELLNYDVKTIIINNIEFKNISCSKNFLFDIPSCDSITNIYIIIKNNASLISAKIHETDLSFECFIKNNNNVYHILNFDNITHYATIKNHNSVLSLKFNANAHINIQYDRCVGNIIIRKKLAQSSNSIVNLSEFVFTDT